MALKQNKDGTWTITAAADLEKAVALIEEREETMREVEQAMEEEYDYLTMRDEVRELNEAVRVFMVENDIKHIFRDTYKITAIRRWNTTWNIDKLKAALPKNMLLKVTKLVVDPGKIDDLVRKGTIKPEQIEKALEQTPVKPHIQRYPYKEGQTADDARAEEAALREELSRSDAARAPKPKKRGKP